MDTGSRPPRPFSLQPYTGSSVDIIIGIDVGTTFSGVSYAFMRPGEVPEVQTVTKFTDQTSSNSKIPSIVYYDESLHLKAAGASATTESTMMEAEFEGWTKVEYFKMNLRPANMKINTQGLNIPPLPSSLTATKVMGDFLRYLYQETLAYIETRHVDGGELLQKVKGRETFVLSHPNGWDTLSQHHLCESAIRGGLIGGSISQRARLRFVSEGEASALACLANGLCPTDLQIGYRFVIADAGGGTFDTTSYEIRDTSPLRLEEITSSDCRFAGSVFINLKARELLQKKLRDSLYDNPEILDEITHGSFENTLKRQFSDSSKTWWLKVGNRSDNNTALSIRRGDLQLGGPEIAECFKFSVDEVIESVKHQIVSCGRKPMPVWLMGGFGSSFWLFKQLKEGLINDGIIVSRPDFDLSKAVANGAVRYALEHTATSPTTRASDGVVCKIYFPPSYPEHMKNACVLIQDVDGSWKVPDSISITETLKSTQVRDEARSPTLSISGKQNHDSHLLQIGIAEADPSGCLDSGSVRTLTSAIPLARKHLNTLGHSENNQEPQKRIRTSPISNPAHRTSIAMHTDFSHGLSSLFSKLALEKSECRSLQHAETTRIDPSSCLFHDKSDLCSESEIIGDCETLNSKIREAALFLIDEWETSLSLSRRRMNLLIEEERNYLKSTLGKNIYKSIRQLSSPDVQGPITDALQGLAVNAAFGIISAQLCPGLPQDTDRLMRKTFEHMLTTESQAAALRWRAMTYAHSTDATVINKFTERHVNELAYWFSVIFILAGQNPDSSFLSEARMRQFIKDSEIIDHALQLSKKLALSFFSVHLDVFMIDHGEAFSEDIMEFDDEKTPERNAVSCTLELGIHEVSSPKQSQKSSGRILMKPKVQLQS